MERKEPMRGILFLNEKHLRKDGKDNKNMVLDNRGGNELPKWAARGLRCCEYIKQVKKKRRLLFWQPEDHEPSEKFYFTLWAEDIVTRLKEKSKMRNEKPRVDNTPSKHLVVKVKKEFLEKMKTNKECLLL